MSHLNLNAHRVGLMFLEVFSWSFFGATKPWPAKIQHHKNSSAKGLLTEILDLKIDRETISQHGLNEHAKSLKKSFCQAEFI